MIPRPEMVPMQRRARRARSLTLRRERDEYLALAQRAKADFENYRKRAQRDAAEAEKRGRGKLAGALLPSVDNLERAMLAAGIDPRRDQAVSEEVSGQEALARGVELVHAELQNSLATGRRRAVRPARRALRPHHQRGDLDPPGRR